MGIKNNNHIKIVKKNVGIPANSFDTPQLTSIFDLFNKTVPEDFVHPYIKPPTVNVDENTLATLRFWRKIRLLLDQNIDVLKFMSFIECLNKLNKFTKNKKPLRGNKVFFETSMELGLIKQIESNLYEATENCKQLSQLFNKLEYLAPFDWGTIQNFDKTIKDDMSKGLSIVNSYSGNWKSFLAVNNNKNTFAVNCSWKENTPQCNLQTFFFFPNQYRNLFVYDAIPPTNRFTENDIFNKPKYKELLKGIRGTLSMASSKQSIEVKPFAISRKVYKTFFRGNVNGKEFYVLANTSGLQILEKLHGQKLDFYVIDNKPRESEYYARLFCKKGNELVYSEDVLLLNTEQDYWQAQTINKKAEPLIDAYYDS